MARKNSPTAREPIAVTVKTRPRANSDEALTLAEATRLRESLKQALQGKTRPWAEIKDELGL